MTLKEHIEALELLIQEWTLDSGMQRPSREYTRAYSEARLKSAKELRDVLDSE